MVLKSLVRGAVPVLLLASAALAIPGCGGSDDDDKSPQEYCQDGINTLCRKFFNCFSKEELALAASFIGNSTSDCQTKLGSQCTADAARCDTGEKFNATRAKQCVEGFEDFSCNDLLGFQSGTTPQPAACDLTCEQQ